jgi:hypothetical protein
MKIAVTTAFLAGLFQTAAPAAILTTTPDSGGGGGPTTTGECSAEGELCSSADDFEMCYYGKCDDTLTCKPTIPAIPSGFGVSFDGEANKIFTQYADKTDAAFNVKLTFDYTPYADPEGIPVDFEAIIFAGPTCGGDAEIIAATSGAIFADAYVEPTEGVWNAVIEADYVSGPKLKIATPLTSFRPEFYKQKDSCSDDVGIDENPTDEACGLLQFCVEFQAVLCGKKVDFVDVYVEIELDIQVSCEENCVDVKLQRGSQSSAKDDADAGYPIACVVCGEDDPSYFTIEQGETMEACIEFLDNVPDGACIVEILEYGLSVELPNGTDVTYTILEGGEYCTGDLCLFPGVGGISFEGDGASIDFQPPAWVFQEVLPGGSIKAEFTGTVILGFGCYCAEDPQAACYPEGEGRKLQAANSVTQQTFTATIPMINLGSSTPGEPEPAPPSGGMCGMASLLGMCGMASLLA